MHPMVGISASPRPTSLPPVSIATILLFFLLNSGLNIFNKWALGYFGFKFPFLLTGAHAVVSFAVMLPFIYFKGQLPSYRATLRRNWRGICAVGVCLAANIALNNLSLVHISLGLNQIIRSSIPVATALVTARAKRRAPPAGELVALCIISAGVALTMAEASANGDAFGAILCLCGVFAGAGMLTAASVALREHIHALQLAFCTAPVTAVAMLPLIAVFELKPFLAYSSEHAGDVIFVIGFGSLMAAAYNVVHYKVVQISGPVMTAVLGQLKIICLIVVGSILFGDTRSLTDRMKCGCAIALGGFGLYSWRRLPKKNRNTALGNDTPSQ